MRLACIGIGSNAIRLLTADWSEGRLCVVRRERRGTRLFAGLVDGALTKESIQASVEAVGQLALLARADGAAEVFVFATSAVRDARNAEEFTARAGQIILRLNESGKKNPTVRRGYKDVEVKVDVDKWYQGNERQTDA